MKEFPFHPELFGEMSRLLEALAEAGYRWFSDYGSIDLEHEDYGLEVTGIRGIEGALGIADVLLRTFPAWRYGRMFEKKWWTAEPGWKVTLTARGRVPLPVSLDYWRAEAAQTDSAPVPVRGEVALLVFRGDLDADNLAEFSQDVDRLLQEGRARIALDTSRLDFVSSAALGYILRLKQRTEEHGGGMVLVRPNPQLRKALHVLGLDEHFRVFDSAEAAVRHFAARATRRAALPDVVLFGLLDRPEECGLVHGVGKLDDMEPDGLSFRWRVPAPPSESAVTGLDASNFDLRVRPGVRMPLKFLHERGYVEVLGIVASIERHGGDDPGLVTIRVRPAFSR